ncbi:tyrosine-type recombinase/integrase [Nocardioides caeni]|nr:site-specific integrase [Nocardioides caeni]
MTLGNVKPTHVREWLTERGEVLAPSTLKYVRTFLAAVMASARDDRLITWSPVEGVTVKAAGRSTKAYRQEVLTDEQVEALRKAMPERYHALVTLLAVAGLRIGEALALTVDDIDREAGVIHVRRSMAPNGKTAGPVKSAQSDRAVPVPRDLVKVLSAHMLAFPPLDHVLGRLVFSTPTGLPVRYHRLRWQFEQAAIKAEVPGATPHALRHRAGSVLLNAGVPAATVARALGHTERVLLDIYSHALPEGDDLLRAAMAQRARSGTDVARKGLRVAK